jgi:hypothetical protein
MESAFGYDFSRVRIHTDAKAAEISSGLNARAFTIGRDVAFASGEYQPSTLIGDALIAHELAHVVQQSGGLGSEVQYNNGSENIALEEDADISAIRAVMLAWGGAKGAMKGIGKKAQSDLRSGLRLQRCQAAPALALAGGGAAGGGAAVAGTATVTGLTVAEGTALAVAAVGTAVVVEETVRQSRRTEPSPEPRPGPRIEPFPIPETDEDRRKGCTVEEVEPSFGRYPCHSDFAKTFSGTRREFLVTEPNGISVTFDAKRGPILYEVKTGYGWILNKKLSPEMEKRKAEVIERFQNQHAQQFYVAARCGYELDWYFNNEHVATFFDSLIAPTPVKWKPYDCDTDSDHTW